MREIKFRVWDDKIKVMSSAKNNDAREYFLHFGGTRAIRCYDGYSERTIVWDEEFKNRYTIQQYTGLKDKNGVEIYEGDIMATLPKLVVKYYNGGFILDNPINELGRLKMMKQYADKKDDFMYHSCKNSVAHIGANTHLTVIGNIFENPELIKQ